MPLPDPEAVCMHCQWYHAKQLTNGFTGECHRYPPIHGLTPQEKAQGFGRFRVTNETEWCGDWLKAKV